MPFSHHSHSGQFCGHAVSTLEEVVQDALTKGMTTFCLTEHMPREEIDFYPEEKNVHSEESLRKLYDDFYGEACRLRKAYADRMRLFLGFEGEWIRDSTPKLVNGLLQEYPLDLFIGSVHHVHTVPIDIDVPTYHKARGLSGGTDEGLFADYFDAQYEMLKTLKPPVIGHFDLIRLLSDDPNGSFKSWPSVWDKIERNLQFIAGYGGVVELNSSSLRKGMTEAYPKVEICKALLGMGGRFTLSDDSHGVQQVGLNYDKVLHCIQEAGISTLHHIAPRLESSEILDARFPEIQWQAVSVEALQAHPLWKR